MTRAVTRGDRIRDVVAVACVVAGAAVFIHGWQLLAHFHPERGNAHVSAFFEYDHDVFIAVLGLGIIAAGIAVAVWSHWRYRHRDPET